MDYYKVSFRYETEIDSEIVSDVLAAELGEAGFESFAGSGDGLDAYIPEKVYNEERLEEQLRLFPLENVRFRYTAELVPGRDWNEEWEKNYFRPIRIGNECQVRASFHEKTPGLPYDIVIDPRMAFGTGNHETTFLMISEMLGLDLAGCELLDMGCGTAVLAILAAMKGCSRVVAVDIDEWAYANALDNIRINGAEGIEVKLGGAEQLAGAGRFDVVFANINRNILLNDICRYAACMKPGGRLFVSGFYTRDVPAIQAECRLNGLLPAGVTVKNDWAAAQFAKPLANAENPAPEA
ncbi:MAG: 50S ribosomal protein L11 methyltransferase [Parabacteroides sp.]|nr:50S ribosomal protein L11 methyltransferase [Parabacteroides sp.]